MRLIDADALAEWLNERRKAHKDAAHYEYHRGNYDAVAANARRAEETYDILIHIEDDAPTIFPEEIHDADN